MGFSTSCFSIINHLLGEKPDSINAIGYSHFQNKQEDVVHVALNYKTNKKFFTTKLDVTSKIERCH